MGRDPIAQQMVDDAYTGDDSAPTVITKPTKKNESSSYIVLTPETLKLLTGVSTSIVFNSAPELIIKTKHAGDAVHIAQIAQALKERGWENYKLTGSSDGWCFLTIQFHPTKTIKI